MATLLILGTEWPSGMVHTTELTKVVNDFADAVRRVEDDLNENGTEVFKKKVMDKFINNHFAHLRNGSTNKGVMYLYLPDADLDIDIP